MAVPTFGLMSKTKVKEMETTHKDILIRVQGDIFNHALQDILRLDGLFIAVKKGFSIIHSGWMKYRENPNPRLDSTTCVYVYNDGNQLIPMSSEANVLVSRALNTMVQCGVRRIGMSPIHFIDADMNHISGQEADEILDRAILSWLEKDNNNTKVEAIFVIDLHGYH